MKIYDFHFQCREKGITLKPRVKKAVRSVGKYALMVLETLSSRTLLYDKQKFL